MARKHVEVPKIAVDLHQHHMSQFLQCPYKYYMSNVARYVPHGIKKALNIGDLFAQCVYFLHNGEDLAKCMLQVATLQNEIMKNATSQQQIDELETSVMVVQSMLMGYEQQFLKEDILKVTKYNKQGGIDGFDNIKIQKIIPEYRMEIIVEIGNYRYIYINRLDGKIFTETNPWILEIKTTTLLDEDLLKKLNTNFQINSYWFAALHQNTEIDGVLYRYIRKPSIRQKKDETLQKYRVRLCKDYQERPEFYFHEESLYFNQDAIINFKKDLQHYFEELTRCYVTKYWERRGTACYNNFGLCEYLKYCSNPTEETLRTYYERC